MTTRSRAPKKPRETSTRASVSLSPDVYDTLQALAREKKVSIAWVMRDAAEKYLESQWPLLKSVAPNNNK